MPRAMPKSSNRVELCRPIPGSLVMRLRRAALPVVSTVHDPTHLPGAAWKGWVVDLAIVLKEFQSEVQQTFAKPETECYILHEEGHATVLQCQIFSSEVFFFWFAMLSIMLQCIRKRLGWSHGIAAHCPPCPHCPHCSHCPHCPPHLLRCRSTQHPSHPR